MVGGRNKSFTQADDEFFFVCLFFDPLGLLFEHDFHLRKKSGTWKSSCHYVLALAFSKETLMENNLLFGKRSRQCDQPAIAKLMGHSWAFCVGQYGSCLLPLVKPLCLCCLLNWLLLIVRKY